jgi:hypothetical protein
MLASERLLEIEEKFGELENFPHHKHIGQQENMQPSTEASLEEVMVVIRSKI